MLNNLEAAGLARTKGSKEVAEFIETECEVTTDNTLWSRQRKDAINRGSDFLAAWDEVFSQRNADGELVPNTTFYGIIKPKDEINILIEPKLMLLSLLINILI